VSILCIQSEHAIGFLKGHFQSLKGLCIHIKDEKTHIIATYWVAACIGIHSFAIQNETEALHQENNDEIEPFHDSFIDEGLTDSDTSSLGLGSSSDDLNNPAVHAH